MPETFADSLFGGYRAAQGDQMSRALALADQMMKEQSMQHQVRMDEIATRRADEQERRNQATEKFNQDKLAAETKWYQDQRFNTALLNAENVLKKGTPFGAVYPALARIDPDAAKEWGTGYVKRMQAYMDEQNRKAKRNTPPPGMEGQQPGMPGATPPMMPPSGMPQPQMPGIAPPGLPPPMPPQGIPTPPQIGMPGQSAQGPPMMPPMQQPPMGQMPNQAMPPGMPLPQPGLPPQGMMQPPMAQPPAPSDMPPQKQLTLEDIMGMQSPEYLADMELKREAQDAKDIHAKAAATRAANDTYRAMTTDPQRLQLQKERNDLELRKIMNDEKAMENGWGKWAYTAAYLKNRLAFDEKKLNEIKTFHQITAKAAMIRANAAQKTADWKVAQDPNRKEAVSIYNRYQAQANVAQKRSDDLQESANSLLIAINNAETLAAKSRSDAEASPNNKEYAAIAAGAEANLQQLYARAYGRPGQSADSREIGLIEEAKKAKDDVQVLKHLVGQMNADLFGNKFKATTDGKGAGTIPSLPRRPKNTIQSQEDAVVNKFLGK